MWPFPKREEGILQLEHSFRKGLSFPCQCLVKMAVVVIQ